MIKLDKIVRMISS